MFSRERRQHRRYVIDLPARFRIVPPSQPGRASPFQEARLTDLSEGGARLLTNTVQVQDLHIFQPTQCTSEQCVLLVEIPDTDPPHTLRARVIWYDHAAEDSAFTFQAGLQFIDTTADQKKDIRSYVQRLKSNRC